jgi:hypothetical protein
VSGRKSESLDPKRPIREADIAEFRPDHFPAAGH